MLAAPLGCEQPMRSFQEEVAGPGSSSGRSLWPCVLDKEGTATTGHLELGQWRFFAPLWPWGQLSPPGPSGLGDNEALCLEAPAWAVVPSAEVRTPVGPGGKGGRGVCGGGRGQAQPLDQASWGQRRRTPSQAEAGQGAGALTAPRKTVDRRTVSMCDRGMPTDGSGPPRRAW